MLTGQAKTDYQREYMRKRRSNGNLVRPKPVSGPTVRPSEVAEIRARLISMTIAEIEAEQGWCPNWRKEMG